IDISGFRQINIQLNANETGSGANSETKFIKSFYCLNGGSEILFNTKGENIGNWGSTVVEQKGITGQTLQIVCYIVNHYSSDKVILDEILVTGEKDDSVSPFITSVNVLTADTLEFYFNEPVLAESIIKSNFILQSATTENIEIQNLFKSADQENKIIALIQPQPFPEITLTVTNIADLEGNITAENSFSFEYFPPVNLHDLVINELMPDPNPKVGLPESEYIELFNTKPFPINVENWLLRINGIEKKLQKSIVLPGGFLVLCSTGSIENLHPFGNVSNVVGFQGLLNKGALVEILDVNRNLIDLIFYSDDWYSDDGKDGGGWSLERIDPLRHCNQPENWSAGFNSLGGTPGTQNSVFGENPDLVFPFINWVVAISENKIELYFSENMDTSLLIIPENYSLNGIGDPERIEIISPELVILDYKSPFQKNKIYTLELNNMADECGNHLLQNNFEIQWNVVKPGDLIINEVLFNPFPDGDDFVEIYNNSEKLISYNRLFLATRNDSFQLKQIYQFSESKNLFFPESYLVLTKDTNGVFPIFNIKCPKCFLQMEQFPTFPNDEGEIVLLNEEMQVSDEFFYFEKMHNPLLADVEGISLERVSFFTNTNIGSNWHSASWQSGYGTPGYENSQIQNENIIEPLVTFSPESFSPNSDGYNDEYQINYQLENPGYIANIVIFDATGRLVTKLAENEILGTNGIIVWNGENETGQRQNLGVYVVVVEIFNMQGNIHRFKDGVVLTDILE
ncbi:MAG: hypothetical protein HOG79_16145, partial [Prolixibacteraceae bacterium]|nr:hypothetical protein [Prolixibacteraceae bacterium]